MGSHLEGNIYKEKKTFQKWLKIILPTNKLRYYPSVFVLRNPIEQLIRKADKQGNEVVIISFYIPNKAQVVDQLGQEHFIMKRKRMKEIFKKCAIKHINDDQIVCLVDQYSDTLSLVAKMKPNEACSIQINKKIKDIITDFQLKITDTYPNSIVKLDYGYLFLNLNQYTLEESFRTAFQNATIKAEQREAREYNKLLFDINSIIASKQISILAQSIMEVSNGKINAWEFLTRGPKNTILESPLQLFAVAKQTNKLFALEMLILEKAFQLIKESNCRERVFLNFTPTSLNNIHLIKEVNRILGKFSSINPKNVVIEVTEQDSIDGLMNFEQNVKDLRNLGFQIAVDDTGAGYASLHTISKIMPDIIKIDRSVIKNIDTDRVKESMLQGLLLVAKETNSLVVAEGIERSEEVQVLTRNKVDLAQGYFYAKPHILPSH